MVDSQLFGPSPAGFHLTNLCLHIINALLLFGLLARMTRTVWPSALVAALFALHPLHVEPVAWVTGRAYLVSTFWMLLAIMLYRTYASQGGAWRYVAIAGLLILAAATTPMLVCLPLLLLLFDYWPLQRIAPPPRPSSQVKVIAAPGCSLSYLAIEKLPLVFISAVFSLVTWLAHRHLPPSAGPDPVALSDRLANAVVSYVRYMGKMFWPLDLLPLYPHPNLPGGTAWTAAQVIGACVILLAISLLTVAWFRRRYLIVGWLWYLILLLPVIGLIQVGEQAMADRYTYVPLIGLFIMISWGGAEAVESTRVSRKLIVTGGSAVIVAIMVLLMVRAASQVQVWRSSLALFTHAAKVRPGVPTTHNNLGVALKAAGQLDEAIGHYRLALAAKPEYADALNNLGNALVEQGRPNEAIRHLEKALMINRRFPAALNNLGRAYGLLDNHTQAIDRYEQALALDRDFAEARFNLGNELAQADDMDQAIVHFREAARLLPNNVLVLNRIAWLVASHGNVDHQQTEMAIQLAERAVALTRHEHPVMLDTLAAAYAAAGRFEEAVRTAQKAISLARQARAAALVDQIGPRLQLYLRHRPYVRGKADRH